MVMMLNQLRAEWIKVNKNKTLTGFLVWIIPVGQFAFAITTILAFLVSERAALPMAMTSSHQWDLDMLGIWSGLTKFPFNVFGRLFPLAFMSVVFAGEYEWDTWKNVIPRGRRGQLILSKYIILIGLVMLSFTLAGLITATGHALDHKLLGLTYGPEFNWENFLDFLTLYSQQFLLGLLSLLILAGFAALAAILTRSILGALLAGLGFAVIEPMSLALLIFLRAVTGNQDLVNLYLITPTFHLDNAHSWFFNNQPATTAFTTFSTEIWPWLSVIVLLYWAALLTTLAVMLFQRQDIT
jgi:ABC-type transport system involved in multi-copper enzyme maturation permease subunit